MYALNGKEQTKEGPLSALLDELHALEKATVLSMDRTMQLIEESRARILATTDRGLTAARAALDDLKALVESRVMALVQSVACDVIQLDAERQQVETGEVVPVANPSARFTLIPPVAVCAGMDGLDEEEAKPAEQATEEEGEALPAVATPQRVIEEIAKQQAEQADEGEAIPTVTAAQQVAEAIAKWYAETANRPAPVAPAKSKKRKR